jgi:acyl carrier protein
VSARLEIEDASVEALSHAPTVRAIVLQHARLSGEVSGMLTEDTNLYEAGLTSLTTVNLMLALEEHFSVEFTDKMLGRKTFSSVRSLAEAISLLLVQRAR